MDDIRRVGAVEREARSMEVGERLLGRKRAALEPSR